MAISAFGFDAQTLDDVMDSVSKIKADKDWKGDSISGSAKEKKIKAIMSETSLSRSKAEELYDIMYGKIK